MRQTCQSNPGTTHQCSAQPATLFRPQCGGPGTRTTSSRRPRAPVKGAATHLDGTPNHSCEPASSAIPRRSGLGGNTHLMDALELLLPLNGTSANLNSATSGRQRRSQRHANRGGPAGARRRGQAASPGALDPQSSQPPQHTFAPSRSVHTFC